MKLNSMFSSDGSKKEKYGRKKVIHPSGLKFDSMLEAAVYDTLCLMKRAGEIKEIRTQETFHLTKAKIGLRVDFVVVTKDGKLEAHESKGMETTDFNIKKRLYAVYGPMPLVIWKGSHKKVFIDETIIPKGE